jgi:hypothetical protein
VTAATRRRRAPAWLVLPAWLALLAVAAAPAHAQPADGTTERLIQILVKNGVLTRAQADSLLEQARAETRAASAPAPAGAAAQTAHTVRVTHVPETVRQQIAAEVKQEVMQQARDEGWAEPSVIPEWVQRIKVSGDVRVRGQWDLFPSGNSPDFPNFNAINNLPNGFDATGGTLPPLLNTTANRFLPQLRARLGVEAQLSNWASTEIRLATGVNNGPVSTNQTLGTPGDFSKYAVWIDRAYIRLQPQSWLDLYAGREPNPFWTSDLLFWDELNFDGFAGQGRYVSGGSLDGFLNLGAFPVYNTAFNLGSTNETKTKSDDSWLLAVQAGATWKPEDWITRLAAGFFDFSNIQGKESAPCYQPTSFGSCSTDATYAPFLQYGNTVFPIRNITTTATSTAQPQFYGLASRFEVLDLHAQTTWLGWHPTDLRLEADYVRNFGFDSKTIQARNPPNNLGANNLYVGGNNGYMLRLTVGQMELARLWDWNVSLTYKYIESDAVLDALTDSVFHLGGTNAKGFVLGGNLALARNLWLTAKWYGTSAVSGPAYSVDTMLVDLNAKF